MCSYAAPPHRASILRGGTNALAEMYGLHECQHNAAARQSPHAHTAPRFVSCWYAAAKSLKKRCWSAAYVSMSLRHSGSSGRAWSEGRPECRTGQQHSSATGSSAVGNSPALCCAWSEGRPDEGHHSSTAQQRNRQQCGKISQQLRYNQGQECSMHHGA